MPADATQQDLEECRQVIRVHSRSFHAASLLLPGRMRDAAVATYAFCRGADDDVDAHGTALEKAQRHALTRTRLDALYAGQPMPTAVGRAFAWVVHTFSIPKAEPVALLDGMQQDLAQVRVPDEDALLAYCYRAAGVVGLMMSRIMGRGDRMALQRAVDLGMAMQLTNIARDVGEDARNGRVYLPQTWLVEAGSSQEQVLEGKDLPAIRAVNLRVLALAERFYVSGMDGISLLPGGCRPAILAAALIYREIGMKVLARGGDGMTERMRVGGMRKAVLACVSVLQTLLLPRFHRSNPGPHDGTLHTSLERQGLAP